MDYDTYIESKSQTDTSVVIDISPDDVNTMLFPFQRDLVVWAYSCCTLTSANGMV